MKKTLIYLGLILSMALTSCMEPSPYQQKIQKAEEQARKSEQDKERVANVANRIVFFKEKRTGICFAYTWYDRSATITIVPEELVKDFLIEY